MGASGSLFEVLVDTDQVQTIGKNVQDLGDQLYELINQVHDVVEEVMMNGMKGQVQLSLDNAYTTVGQSMTDHTTRVTNVGEAVGQVAINTADMDADVASKLSAQ